MTGTVDERVVDVLESNRQLTDNFMDTKRNYTMAKTEPKEAPVKAGYTAAELAEELGIEAAELRKHLRTLEIEKPAAGWTWPNAKAAASVKKAVEARIKDLAKSPAKAAPKAKEEPAPKAKPVRKSRQAA